MNCEKPDIERFIQNAYVDIAITYETMLRLYGFSVEKLSYVLLDQSQIRSERSATSSSPTADKH